MKLVDLTGMQIGNWRVLCRDTSKKGVKWLCVCKCGKESSVSAHCLKTGRSLSCGCSRRDVFVQGKHPPNPASAKLLRKMRFARFGKLMVCRRVWQIDAARDAQRWLCLCDCGMQVIASTRALEGGGVFSCKRCIPIESQNRYKHGHTGGRYGKCSATYYTWNGMKSRCRNPKSTGYERYGGRGVMVCRGMEEFEGFIAVMGERPDGRTLDRIDNDRHYSCGRCHECLECGWEMNCRWASLKTQNRNKNSNRKVVYNGEEHLLIDLCDFFGISPNVAKGRLRGGWSVEKALSTPVGGG